ncbi:MAG: chorismate synthase, partial [Spirochaetes bacterium]|nr:chorismate synthase [Spirochaetota bacterium]
MAGNSFGKLFRVTTFGESHGAAMGCVVDGCPAGLPLSQADIHGELLKRRPGGGDGAASGAASGRNEADTPEILSGVFDGVTLGTPIAVVIRNTDARPGDYDHLKDVYRGGHADWTWEAKFGIRDHRGGGRSSGRETVGRVAAGAVAKIFLARHGIAVRGWVSSIFGVTLPLPGESGFDLNEAGKNPLRVPCSVESSVTDHLLAKIEGLRAEGDSCGGIVSCSVTGLPPGLGEPVFDKLDAVLAAAMLSIGGCKGVEFGAGFAAAAFTGSQNNDEPVPGGG